MQLFKDITVLELASVLAGPSVGQFFAELGATVIKIENQATGGDVTRGWRTASEDSGSTVSAYFSSANWGKKSVLLNLKQPKARKAVHQLAQKADIVIASYKAGDAEKLQMDYETLRQLNPKLIYGQISGYGSQVPRAGYDAVVQAESGFMYLNGQADGPPTKMPVALVDILAAHQLKEGILASLYHREKTGEGALIEVSLFDAAVTSLANQAANYLVAGHNPQRMGSEHPNIVPYGSVFYDNAGKPLVLAIGDDRQFARLCKILNLENLPENEKFRSNKARVQNRNEVNQLLEERIKSMGRAFLLAELEKCHVPAGAVYDLEEVFSLPAAAQLKLQDHRAKGFKKPGVRHVAFRSEQIPLTANLSGPPETGADTFTVLATATNLSADEIKAIGSENEADF